MSEIEAVTFPRIVHEGTYRLWEKADGTLHVAYLRTGNETEDHFEIPGEMLNMAKAASQGKLSPFDMLRSAMKLMGNMG